MTTPRVTVPVEPEYTATDYLRLIAEGWEVIESTGSQMTIKNPEDDGPQDLVIDVDAILSAAPAPEGGAVEYGVRTEGAPGITEPDPALATRQEAPAGAAAKRLRDDLDEGRIKDFAVSRDVATILSALRAQPPAREDAGSTERAARQDRLYDSAYAAGLKAGWNLAQEDDEDGLNRAIEQRVIGHRAVIEAARDEDKAREDAQPVAGDWQSIAMWMGFAASVIKSGEPWTDQCQREFDEAKAAYARLSVTHPAPDALREALHRAEYVLRSVQKESRDGHLVHDAGVALEALAALQAEQKGGA